MPRKAAQGCKKPVHLLHLLPRERQQRWTKGLGGGVLSMPLSLQDVGSESFSVASYHLPCLFMILSQQSRVCSLFGHV